jgi:hypothetical protein
MSTSVVRNPQQARKMILGGTAPEGLTVGGYLYLGGCTGLTALPEGLTVGGYLYLGGCTGLTALPEGLTVGGHLYYSQPAPYLATAKNLTCKSLRPVLGDRKYWGGLLGLDVSGCWPDIYARIQNRDPLMQLPGLEPWQIVAIQHFRG